MARDLGIKCTDKIPYYFISYNTEDEKVVAEYVKCLEQQKIPMWYDKGIKIGSGWETEIAEKIDGCQAVIMFLSKGIFLKKASYVYKEYKLATEYSKKDVYVIMLDEIRKPDVPINFRAWWTDVSEIQCLNAFEYDLPHDAIQKFISEVHLKKSERSIDEYKPVIPTFDMVNFDYSGNISAIIDELKPALPFALRRTKWKTTTLFFVVEEIKEKYAYGYMMNNGIREQNTRFPIFSENIIWNIVEPYDVDDNTIDGWDDIIFEEQELILYSSRKYVVEFDTVRANGNVLQLSFWIQNNTKETINIYAHNIEVDGEEIEEYMEIATVLAGEEDYYYLDLEDMPDDPYFDISLSVEVNTEDNEVICESDVLDMYVSLENEELQADVLKA